MFTLTSNDYINFIISYLKDDSKIPKDKFKEETKEGEIDIFSKNFFEQLYHNLLYFYKLSGKKNIGTDVQRYFFSEISNILGIIHEVSPTIFFDNNFLKATLIYIIYSLKTPITVNPEIVLKFFFGFMDILEDITNIRIKNELFNFEPEIVKTINQLIAIYYMDSDFYLDISTVNNFKEIMSYLKKYRDKLPIYLKGFIEYNKKSSGEKFLIMKIYKYFQLLNPYADDMNKNTYLYQGYSLYGILSYKNCPKINFDEFRNIKANRINNNDAKNILILAIKLLQEKDFRNFLSKLEKENLYYSSDTSKVLDTFDDTKNYYEDLYNQLKFYISLYKDPNNHKACEIYNNNYSRILWLNYNKLLLLNLSEKDCYKENIKIIFYFIVNLFNPDIDSSSLEFRSDIVPKLFLQTITSIEILDFPEIYKNIDKNYSEYYPNSEKENIFTQTFINMVNKKILNKLKPAIYQMSKGNQTEIKNIEKHNLILPFPLLQDYLSELKKNINKNNLTLENIYNFYKYCFLEFESLDQKNFIGIINNTDSLTNLIEPNDIKEILDNINFIDLVKNIMKSPVMKEAYTQIFYYYLSNGDFDIDKETLQNEILYSQRNLIINKTILDYYNEFCEKLNDLNFSKLFIVMNLPESIKAFTFGFLKIVINSEGVKLKTKNNAYLDKSILLIFLQVYLIFLIIHEFNHFMKRYLHQNKSFKICKTQEIKEYKEVGEHLIKILFGHILIGNCLNLEQANYILNIENWHKKSVYQFKKDFMNIKKNAEKDKCIVFLISEENTICDHSKLFG